jgi:phosphoribosylanthranilate isomerase
MTKVKICGINDSLAFDTAVEAGADWVGFVFFPGSPRYITPATAAGLSGRITGGPLRVGLFVEPSDVSITAALDTVPLDILQIYGREGDLCAMRDRFGLPIWRPVGVASSADLPVDSPGTDMLLLEAKPPVEATRPGGNATSFDWTLLRDWAAPKPWILAGGLTPDNVAAAISQTGAGAVDVSSGVERAKGVKDPALIRAFIVAAKGTNAVT